jgi:hypothetical protein
MPEREQKPHWRWASLAAVVALLMASVFFLGSHMVAAQDPSPNPSSSEQTDSAVAAALPASSPTHGLPPERWIRSSSGPSGEQASLPES